MDRLYRTIVQLGRFKVRCDDDFTDRLNYIYTVVLVVLFSIIVSTRQYIGESIVCWVPAHFTNAHQRYANNICWIANTYWLPIQTTIPDDVQERTKTIISYYQWVPFMLVSMGIVFIIPSLVWRSLGGKSGINIRSIVEVSVDIQNLNPDVRAKCVRYLSRHIESCLENQREYRTGWFVRLRHKVARTACIFWGRRYGNYLVVSYMIVKFLFLFNSIAQLMFLNGFLHTNSTLYGFSVIQQMIKGESWEESGIFPRVTMCDFQIRQLGNVHRHTVQCVLPVNMFNEKIFIFIWFWLTMLIVFNVLSTASWLSTSFCKKVRMQYVKKYLKITGRYKKEEMKLADRFVEQYLRMDGVFVLRIIARNAGDLMVSEIISMLYGNFMIRVKKLENPDNVFDRKPIVSTTADGSINETPPIVSQKKGSIGGSSG